MSTHNCPKCGAEHDGSMDANGWATCKSCVHLWNLKKELTKSQTAKAKESETPAASDAEPAEKEQSRPIMDGNFKREVSGYFPEDTAPPKTAPLTKKEKSFSESALGPLPSEEIEMPPALPANSTMIKVEEESRAQPVLPDDDESNAHRVTSDFPDMATRFTDNDDGNISCPVCGASFEGDASKGEVTCPHCDTSFNTNTGRYQVKSNAEEEVDVESARSYTGEIVGGCKIGQKLGEGGMGSVYKAKQLSLDRDVALKLLPPALTSQQNFMQRFQQEARSLARVNHSNIIGIYEFGEDKEQNLHYMMMEYVAGEDLADVLRRRHHLTELETIDMLKQSALGLEQAAQQGIIHRDIKPDNIMITKDGTCKVSDFGLAKNVASDSTMTNASIRVGTPAFMSPEQCDGLKLDFRSDIYSLGVTAFVMLTGHLPFNGESPFAIMLKHKSEEPPPISASIPHINKKVEALVLRMMAKEPEKRFSSWRVLREELEAVESSLNAKTMAFENDGGQIPGMPSSDLPTERQDLNADAHPDEDISSMIEGLGQLDRNDDDGRPPLRGSGQFDVPEGALLDPVDGIPEASDSAAIPDPVPEIGSDAKLTAQVPDLSLQDSAPPTASGSDAALPAQSASAIPELTLQEPAPLPPSASSPTLNVPATDTNVGHGSQPLPVQAGNTQASAGLSAVTDSTTRTSSSSPLMAETGSETKTGSASRRIKTTGNIKKRMAEAKTEQQQRVTQIRNKAEQYIAKGKYRKAILALQQASQVSTDVGNRDDCFHRIQVVRMLMKQRLKRRAILSTLLLIPTLLAAVFFVTPFAHNYYLSYRLDEIEKLPSDEMQKHHVRNLAQYAKPFAWYDTVFVGMSYELKDTQRLQVLLKKYQDQFQDANGKPRAELEKVDLSELRSLMQDDSVSWGDLQIAANALNKQAKRADDKKEIAAFLEEIQRHQKIIANSTERIGEKLRQGQFTEAEAIGQQLREQEPRAGLALLALPRVFELQIIDDAGQTVVDPTVTINGVRVRDTDKAYSLGNKTVTIEVKHGDYEVFSGDIPVGHDGTFKVVLQPAALWTLKTNLAQSAWVRLQSWGSQRLLLSSADAIAHINVKLGKEHSRIGRGDINIAPGNGARIWTNAIQLKHNELIMGTGDGLLISCGLNENEEFQLNRTIYRGNHAVLNSLTYDFLYRNGSGRALLTRQGGSSISFIGLIDGREEWRQTGIQGAINPYLFFRDDHLFIVDDIRFRKFEEDGTKKDSIQLARQRSGACAWADDNHLAIPHSKGIDVISLAEDTYRVRAAMTSEYDVVGGLVSSGKFVYAAFADGSVRAYVMRGGALMEAWKCQLPDARRPAFEVQVDQQVVVVADDKGSVYCINGLSGQLLRTLHIAAPAVCSPVIVGTHVISLDERGIVSAYQAPKVK